MTDRPPSPTDGFIDAIEAPCLGGRRLVDARSIATAVHDADGVAVAATTTVSELLHPFRSYVGTRSAEWWPATLDGVKTHALPSDAALEVLVVLAADAGGVALPQVVDTERGSLVSGYLQHATLLVALIEHHGDHPAASTLQRLRDRGAVAGA